MTDDILIKKMEEEMQLDKGFIGNNNFKLLKIADNYCEIEAEITKNSLNPYGIAHGGFIFGLADTSAGVAAKTLGKNAVTINSNIDYLHPACGGKIKATASCLKSGRTISVFEVVVTDENNKYIAKAMFNYFYVN
jgi:acyl-CoA thioesterase